MSNNANIFQYQNGLGCVYFTYDSLPREARDYLKEHYIPSSVINCLYTLYTNNRIDKKRLLEALVKNHEEYEKERLQRETNSFEMKKYVRILMEKKHETYHY